MIYTGDCLEVMPTLEAGSVDAVVTDPPYGLGFMGKDWDSESAMYLPPSAVGLTTPLSRFRTGKGPAAVAFDGHVFQEWCEQWATEAFRVAKPGAYLLAFGGTRTYHRLTCAIEDAGWIIRDCLVWAYASGFPKSRALLKPAWEPIVMARKPGPLRELAIDLCRIPTDDVIAMHHGTGRGVAMQGNADESWPDPYAGSITGTPALGRWPANVILTDQDWYTLRDDVGQQPRDLIASYFEAQGLGVDDVPGVREGVRDHAGMGTGRSPEILLTPVQLEGFAGWEAGWDASSSRVDPTDAGLGGEGNGVGVSRLEGRTLVRPERLRERGGVDPDGSGARTGRVDGPEDRQGQAVSPGAPAGDGDDARPAAGTARGSASPQRREGRQQPVEPVPAGSVEPHAGTPDGGSGVGTSPRARRGAGGGERGVTVPLDLIPVGWRSYFRFSHSTAIFDGDTPGVVGGGETTSSAWAASTGGSARGVAYDAGLEGYVHGGYSDSGTYSRFFLLPKAARSEREPVLGGLPTRVTTPFQGNLNNAAYEYSDGAHRDAANRPPRANHHPTVKPLDLMRHLVRLVTPTGGTVLDCFAGSGTTLLAAELEGFPWIGIEREAEYVAIIEARLNGTQRGLGLPA